MCLTQGGIFIGFIESATKRDIILQSQLLHRLANFRFALALPHDLERRLQLMMFTQAPHRDHRVVHLFIGRQARHGNEPQRFIQFLLRQLLQGPRGHAVGNLDDTFHAQFGE